MGEDLVRVAFARDIFRRKRKKRYDVVNVDREAQCQSRSMSLLVEPVPASDFLVSEKHLH